MSKLSLSSGGADAFASLLAGQLEEVRMEVFAALEAEAEVIKTDSQTLVPKDTHSLVESAMTYSHVGSTMCTIGVGYGGAEAIVNYKNLMPAGDYAVEVHENLLVPHKNGEAKFLETAAGYFANNAVNRLASRLGGK